jgi:UDPglucose 6-dehydrogenase
VQAYDPVAQPEAAKALRDVAGIHFATDPYLAAADADAVVIVTEWNEFRNLDLGRMKNVLRRASIVDLRNVLDPERVKAHGFSYVATGRGVTNTDAPIAPSMVGR